MSLELALKILKMREGPDEPSMTEIARQLSITRGQASGILFRYRNGGYGQPKEKVDGKVTYYRFKTGESLDVEIDDICEEYNMTKPQVVRMMLEWAIAHRHAGQLPPSSIRSGP